MNGPLATALLVAVMLAGPTAANGDQLCTHGGQKPEKADSVACYSDAGCMFAGSLGAEPVRGYDQSSAPFALARGKITGIVTSSAPFTSLVMISGLVLGIAQAGALEAPRAAALATLVKAYPDFLDRIDGNDLVWKDGTRQRIDDDKPAKTFEAMLDDPDIKDMFAMTYPAGDKGLAPAVNFDPGRIRYTPLFVKMYGDCQRSNLAADAATVVWLRSKYGKTVKFAKINGAAAALQKVSDELDRLPGRFLEYLRPLQGSFNCRPIAGTNRPSAHGFGIAIDIAAAHSHYWQWSKPDANGRIGYRNEIPWEIVRVFETHGFIWGGKWYHYDTMHFEYRPELLMTAK